jgi:hypothetical protein
VEIIRQFASAGISSSTRFRLPALRMAMRLEFATLPPYLCAEWSIDAGNDPDNVRETMNCISAQRCTTSPFGPELWRRE